MCNRVLCGYVPAGAKAKRGSFIIASGVASIRYQNCLLAASRTLAPRRNRLAYQSRNMGRRKRSVASQNPPPLPAATIDELCRLIDADDADRLTVWLLARPQDAPTFLK